MLLRFLRDRDGGVAPMLALASIPLFASVGAAVDYGRAASARSAMQAAVDAAALILAKDSKNVDVAVLTSSATQYFNANLHNSEVSNVSMTASASSTSGGYFVSLSATGVVHAKIMGVLGFSSMNVSVNSQAMYESDGLGCVLSLNQHVDSAASGQGSTSVVLNGCSLYDNSDHSAALTVGGSAQITAHSVGVVGNVVGASNITTTQGIRTGIGIVADPYAGMSFPPFGKCTDNNFVAHSTMTIQPGVYCGGMMINAGATLTLSPGIYYMDGGDLTVNGGATLIGEDITLVFTSQNRKGYATATINGNATINLTPPKTGPTAGIVIFGDRNMPVGTKFKFNGGSTQYLGGAVYVSKGAIDYSGGSTTNTSCTQLIGDTVAFTGNSKLALNCQNYGTKPFSAPIVKLLS